MLDDIAEALTDNPARNLLFALYFADHLKQSHDDLQYFVAQTVLHGLATPALSSGLTYFDTMRTGRGTANIIQGKRDYFGYHGFIHIDGLEGQRGPWAD